MTKIDSIEFLYPKIDKGKINIIADACSRDLAIKMSTSKSINNKNTTLGYAGSFLPGKGGWETVLLGKMLHNYNFSIAGPVTIEQRRQIDCLDNVKYFGILNEEDLINYYINCDILIAPIGRRIFLDNTKNNEITHYTSPLKIFEYIATCKPIVTFDVPSTKAFSKIPGLWIISKGNEQNISFWNKLLNEIIFSEYYKNTCKLYEERKEFLYSWNDRLIDMLKIK